ncbi:endothelin receptor type B-like [Branchiostoma floridae]|uniref:Endothelin receptor type B-like n=1 Tax=Branchiostoma floridae TaxID=7739 RepID=A0A9J7L7N0_BRAFL|nr:endothelin receptor type B-like [Branchiostoma floridae]
MRSTARSRVRTMVAAGNMAGCRVAWVVLTLILTFGAVSRAGVTEEPAAVAAGGKGDDFHPPEPAIWRNDTSNNETSITVYNTTDGQGEGHRKTAASEPIFPSSLRENSPAANNLSNSRGSGKDSDDPTDESAAGSEGSAVRNATLLTPTFANASGIINSTGDPTPSPSASDEWPVYLNVTHTPDSALPPNAALQPPPGSAPSPVTSTSTPAPNITATTFRQIITGKVPNAQEPAGYTIINSTDVDVTTGAFQDDGVDGSVPYKAGETDYPSPGHSQRENPSLADQNIPINNLRAVTSGPTNGANASTPGFPSATMSWTAAPWNASVVGEPIDYVVVGVSCFTLLVGCIGNLCVLCTVCRHYSMRSVLNILIASLATSDLLQVVLYVPLNAYTAVTDVLPFPGWGVEVVCRGLPVLRALSLGVTVFSLCAFSVDRYRASVNVRLQYEQYESCCRTMEKVFVVWLGALILAVPDAFPPTVRWYQTLFRTANAVDAVCPRNVTKGIPKVMLQVSATYYDIKTWWLLGCYFCLPVLFGLVCFCLSSRRLTAAAKADKEAKDSHKLHLKQSHQTARVVLFLVLAFAFCWLPYHVSTILWRVVDKSVLVKYRTYMVILDYAGFYLSNFQSCVNPLILFTMSEAWRKALNDCCPCCYCFCCCCRCVEVLCCPRRNSKDDPDKLDTELQTVTGASR